MSKGNGNQSKRRDILPYSSLPEAVSDKLEFLFNHLYNLSCVRQKRLRQFEVTFRERLTLELLYAKEDGLPQCEIGRHLDINPNVTVVLIDRLEKRFFVERDVKRTDRRKRVVRLTASGRNFVKSMQLVENARTDGLRAAQPGVLRDFTVLARLLIAGMEKDIGLSLQANVDKRYIEVANA